MRWRGDEFSRTQLEACRGEGAQGPGLVRAERRGLQRGPGLVRSALRQQSASKSMVQGCCVKNGQGCCAKDGPAQGWWGAMEGLAYFAGGFSMEGLVAGLLGPGLVGFNGGSRTGLVVEAAVDLPPDTE